MYRSWVGDINSIVSGLVGDGVDIDKVEQFLTWPDEMKETLDSLSLGDLQLLQSESGYRYSLDPILLARFVDVKKGARVVDLGTGCGIVPLLLARLSDSEELIGIEIQVMNRIQ